VNCQVDQLLLATPTLGNGTAWRERTLGITLEPIA